MKDITKFDCNHHVKTFLAEAVIDEEYNEDYPLSFEPQGLEPGEYTFIYTYPLSTPAKKTHPLTGMNNQVDILLLAKADYKAIYKEEDVAVGKKTKNIPGTLNRRRSDGPYGIWGHGLSDLYFEGVIIDQKNKTVKFEIGS